MPTPDWVSLGPAADLAKRELQQLKARRTPIALCYRDGQFTALSGVCNHVGGPLGDGVLDGDYVTCPWHFWKFHFQTGRTRPEIGDGSVPTYAVKVEDGNVLVDLASAGPRKHIPHPAHPLARAVNPKLAPIAGGFVMAWNATGGMRFQRFAADLTPLDAAVLFEPNGSSLAIDEDGAGGFLLAWVSSGSGLKARRFSAAGTPLTPILDVAPGTIFHTRVKAGSGGFAVSWSDDYIAGTAHVRAFSNAGAPLGASFDAGTGVVELAPLPTGYLLLRNWSGFFTRVLGSDGQALAAEIALGLSGISPLLGQGEDATWLAWQDSETRILGARLDPQGRLEGEPTEVAATIDSTYFVLTHLTPRPGAFQLTWSHYEQGVIPLGPCEYNLGGMTQSFGASRGPVDVPLATPNGRIVLLLLFLVAGLVALRRASPV